MNKKILVTGATGFIGKHIVPALASRGYEVLVYNSAAGDVAQAATWQGFADADVVIHLAGRSFVPASWADPSAFLHCNLMGTVEALNYCKARNARLIFLSSYLYGHPQALPIPETAPLDATNPYALSKKLAEEACSFYAKRFGVDITVLRPFNVYGPGQPSDFLIPSIIRQVQQGLPIRVKDLDPRRDYVYVSDLVSAILASIGTLSGYQVYNIGSGSSYSVQELIEVIQQINGSALPVISAQERRRDEIMDTIADIQAARNCLNWAPEVDLAQGLRQML